MSEVLIRTEVSGLLSQSLFFLQSSGEDIGMPGLVSFPTHMQGEGITGAREFWRDTLQWTLDGHVDTPSVALPEPTRELLEAYREWENNILIPAEEELDADLDSVIRKRARRFTCIHFLPLEDFWYSIGHSCLVVGTWPCKVSLLDPILSSL